MAKTTTPRHDTLPAAGSTDALNRGFNLAPEPAYLLSVAARDWSVAGAISEGFDNALGELRGNANEVEAIWDAKKRVLTLFDNGQGMDRIGSLFRLGKTVGRGPRDIGKYGSGGTMMLIWLADRIRIWTMRNGRVMFDEVVWSEILQAESLAEVFVNDDWKQATVVNTPEKLFAARHGTLIEMHLRPQRIFLPDAVQAALAKTYAPALRKGKKLTWITKARNGQEFEISLADATLDMSKAKERVDFDVAVKAPDSGELLPVHGSVGLFDDLSFNKSRISVGYGTRVIFETRDCFRSQWHDMAKLERIKLPEDLEDKAYTGTGVAGWLDLGEGWQDYLTQTKEAITDDRVRLALMHHVFEQIKPLLEKTEEDRMSLIFEGIALELSTALNSLSGNTTVQTEVMKKKRRRGMGGGETPQPDPDNPIPEILTDPAQQESPQTVEQPATSKINIIPANDADMQGGLCRMQVLSESENNFQMEVNKDHAVIQSILYEKPLNRIALNLLLTGEIASALLTFDAVANRVLPKDIRKELDSVGDEAQRQRLLHRRLFDGARRPPMEDEGDAATVH